jgi:hypothetical protein
MRDASAISPFVAVQEAGETHLVIHSGGCQLIIADASDCLQEAWDWFEGGLADSDHCEAAIKALHKLAVAAGRRVEFHDRCEFSMV